MSATTEWEWVPVNGGLLSPKAWDLEKKRQRRNLEKALQAEKARRDLTQEAAAKAFFEQPDLCSACSGSGLVWGCSVFCTPCNGTGRKGGTVAERKQEFAEFDKQYEDAKPGYARSIVEYRIQKHREAHQ